jgi:RNA polymerase sigma factor (sigma-70 family)
MQPNENKNELYSKLIEGCLKDQRESQYQLYKQLSGKMFAVCMRYAHNREIAEDLLQEGFVKVFTNIDKFRGDGSFEGWVRRIMVNTAVENYRKNNKMYPILNIEQTDLSINFEAPSTDLELEDLVNMIQQLSPGYRTVFNLYVVEGFSHREIADMMQISEGTSKSQLARARYLLMDMIEQSSLVKKPNILAR